MSFRTNQALKVLIQGSQPVIERQAPIQLFRNQHAPFLNINLTAKPKDGGHLPSRLVQDIKNTHIKGIFFWKPLRPRAHAQALFKKQLS